MVALVPQLARPRAANLHSCLRSGPMTEGTRPGRWNAMKSHLLDESALGVFVIAATPFDDDGALDLDSLARLIDFYVGAGVHGLTVLGMMGEAQKLTYEESC